VVPANASGGAGTKFKIEPNDSLFSVDSQGVIASQVMHVLLRRITRRISGFQGVVHLPCGAEKFEPVNSKSETQLAPTSALDVDGFRDAFGVRRSPTFGEAEFEDFLGDGYRPAADELFLMTDEFFNEHFYAPAPTAGRRVYFCFDESLHLVLKRLVIAAHRLESSTRAQQLSQAKQDRSGEPIQDVEAGGRTVHTVKDNSRLYRSPLKDVIVVAIPFGNDIANPPAGIEPFSAAAYKQAYEKMELVIDTSNSCQILENKAFYR